MPSADLPPLRIHHLLVWMAVLATTISIRTNLADDHLNRAPDFSLIADLIFQSLSVTVIVFVVVWRWGEKPLLTEPGHGLLLQLCAVYIGCMIGSLLGRDVARQPSWEPFVSSEPFVRYFNKLTSVQWYFERASWFGQLLESAIVVGCAIWIAHAGRWRAYFFVTAAVLAAQVVIAVAWTELLPDRYWSFWNDWSLFFYSHAPGVIRAAMIFVVVTLDWRDHVRHHWTHWCGVIGLLVTSLISLASGIWEFLNSYDWYSLPPQVPITN